MDDKRRFEIILNSPGSLLQGLGLQQLYLHRPRGPYSGTVELSELDDNIRNRGCAHLWRGFAASGRPVPVRLIGRGTKKDVYKCRWLEFDYTQGEFYFGLCRNASSKIILFNMSDMWQSGYILKPTRRCIELPLV